MKQAFQNNPLTEDEIFKLTAFMQSANDEQGKQHPVNYGRWMLSAGLIGAFMLMGVYPHYGSEGRKELSIPGFTTDKLNPIINNIL